MIRRTGLAIGLLLLAAVPAHAARGLKLLEEDVAVVASPEVKVKRPAALKLVKEARKAFVAIANHLDVSTRSVFHTDRTPPHWMPDQVRRDRRVFVTLDPEAKTADRSWAAILDSLKSGRLGFSIPPPAEKLTPEDRGRLWEGMARAILAATMHEAAPVWLREGFPLAMADEGSSGAATRVAELRKALEGEADEIDLKPVIEALDRDSFVRAGGPAMSYAFLRMLVDANGKFLRSLLRQSRTLLGHVAMPPNPAKLRKEYSELWGRELDAAGLTAATLKIALGHWVAEGFPVGRHVRRSEGGKVLAKARERKLYTVWLSGKFGRNVWDEEAQAFAFWFGGGEAKYLLPWRTEAVVWVGVRGAPGTNYAWRPEKRGEGVYYELVTWRARAEGRRRLPGVRLKMNRGLLKFGFVMFGATSPNGIRYTWLFEVKLK